MHLYTNRVQTGNEELQREAAGKYNPEYDFDKRSPIRINVSDLILRLKYTQGIQAIGVLKDEISFFRTWGKVIILVNDISTESLESTLLKEVPDELVAKPYHQDRIDDYNQIIKDFAKFVENNTRMV